MDMTQIDEQWLDLPREKRNKNTIVSISNTGKAIRADGTKFILKLRQKISYCGQRELCYRIIAEHFLITVKRPDQIIIDHITHFTKEYNVNDVRNLRWCTHSENVGFEESRYNNSKARKSDNVGPSGAYQIALKLYKLGEITEEEFQPYREAMHEYLRQCKIARNTSSPI